MKQEKHRKMMQDLLCGVPCEGTNTSLFVCAVLSVCLCCGGACRVEQSVFMHDVLS